MRQNNLIVNEYNSVAKFLHWAIALLIVLNYIGGLTLGATGYRFMNLHKQFGMLILLLVVLRFLWRIFSKCPDMAEELSPFEKFVAKTGHCVLYLLMLSIPALGITLVESHGYELKFLGVIDIPKFIQLQPKEISHEIKEFHEYLAHMVIIFAGLHALFALKHHFLNKDSVLLRMIPRGNK